MRERPTRRGTNRAASPLPDSPDHGAVHGVGRARQDRRMKRRRRRRRGMAGRRGATPETGGGSAQSRRPGARGISPIPLYPALSHFISLYPTLISLYPALSRFVPLNPGESRTRNRSAGPRASAGESASRTHATKKGAVRPPPRLYAMSARAYMPMPPIPPIPPIPMSPMPPIPGMPPPPGGIGGAFSGISTTPASVAISRPAMDAAS